MEKAIKYVKNNGIQYAKDRIEYCNGARLVGIEIDLKQIVEAFEFIEKEFGSVEIAYYEYMVSGCYSDPFWIKVKQSIELVEKCNASD